MANLPPLPEGSWSDDIHNAYTQMLVAVSRANQLLQEESDPLRLRIHLDNLEGHISELLDAMDMSTNAEDILHGWLHSCAESVGEVMGRLCIAIDAAESDK
jgi:hypothetical protein